MKPTKESHEAALRYAKKFDYDIVEYKCQYKGWLTYYVTSEALKGTFCGFPAYVFVRSDMKCRFAVDDEVTDVMNLIYEQKKKNKK